MKRVRDAPLLFTDFEAVPDEVLSIILTYCHHGVSNISSISKRFYRVISETKDWFDIALYNYRIFRLNGDISNIERIIEEEDDDDPMYLTPHGVRMNRLFDTITQSHLYKTMRQETRYARFLHWMGLLLNSKMIRIIEKDSVITRMRGLESIITYINANIDNPLSLRNFHKNDFYLNFQEEGHSYTLIRATEEPNTTKTVFVDVVSNADMDDNDMLVAPMPDDATSKPDHYIPPMIDIMIENRKRYQFLTSTTKYIHSLYPPFNADKVIDSLMADTKRWNNPLQNKYYGMTKKEIKDKWLKNGLSASEAGTLMHLNLENYYIGKPYVTDTPEFKLFLAFEKDHVDGKLIAYRPEWTINSNYLKICGSVDILYEDINDTAHVNDTPIYMKTPLSKKKHLKLMDWKRCCNVVDYNTWAEDSCGIVPCTIHSGNCNGMHYLIQLCIYKYILEKHYDVIIDAMFLVILHPDQKQYIKKEIKWDVHTQKFIDGIIQHRIDCITPSEPHFDIS